MSPMGVKVGGVVWIKGIEGKEEAFLKGEVVGIEQDQAEIRIDREVRRLPLSEVRLRFARDDDSTAADNTSLVHMNDASILENLHLRHGKDEIYTYTASVLLAVNPYKTIAGLYGDLQCDRYRGKHIGALPPHPYAIADTSYRQLVREKTDQALLISGESGAGKTETAKIVMEYLAYASGAASDLAARIQARVLQAQPILESLGNAVTLRNSNSSRFGKYNRVFFNDAGTLVDAGVTTYLLESSRVVTHGDRERTYHVFYEMLRGLSDQQLQAFNLDRSKSYRLMYCSSPVAGFEDRDKKNFDRLCKALQTVGRSEEQINEILRVIAGLIHLADIQKESDPAALPPKDEEDDENVYVEVNEEHVEAAARLLGMDDTELCNVLKRKKIQMKGRESFYEVARTELQFRQVVHSLIKALYKRLFEKIVLNINDSFKEIRGQVAVSEDEAEFRSIGILDIYGFERLQKNSFEQLCINLANERLQQYFVENVLVAEQSLYKREGLPWKGLDLPDSTPVVKCIGEVFRTLDDFSSRLAKGFGEAQACSDVKFCEKVLQDAAADPQRKDVLRTQKISAKEARARANNNTVEMFVVKHYAGTVDYNTKGWLDKNNDRLLLECEKLICGSDSELVKSLGVEDTQPFRSISKKYGIDLESLLKTLSEAKAHYIRCFKPNEHQKASIFNGQLVLDQIIQCGTIELVKIMHDGYPNRCPFDEITTRFKSLLPESFQRYGMRTFIEALMLAYEVPRDEWALGLSRLFLKAGQLKNLEDMRLGGVTPDPDKLQEIVSGIVRKRWSRAIETVKLVQWLPKFCRQIYMQRAVKALSNTAVVVSRVAPRLEAARQRVADRRRAIRRRLIGKFRAVSFMCSSWRRIREQRRERALTALYRFCFIAARVKPWLAAARESMREAAKRRAREEERRRQELERRLKDEEENMRKEAERRRLEEEERLKKEAECRRQEEEERRQKEEEERQQREEERRREQEARQAEEEEARQRADSERHRLEDEKKRMKEEFEEHKRSMDEKRQRMEEEMEEKRLAWMKEMEEKQAEQQRMMKEQYEKQFEEQRRMLHEETARRLSMVVPAASDAGSAAASALPAYSDFEDKSTIDTARGNADDDTDIGDSASMVAQSMVVQVQAEDRSAAAGPQTDDKIHEMVTAEISNVVKRFEAKQNEVMNQMEVLKMKNTALESQLLEAKGDQQDSTPAFRGTGMGSPSPETQISLISDVSPTTPNSTVQRDHRISMSSGQRGRRKSARYSLNTLSVSRASTGGKLSKRQSAAAGAFSIHSEIDSLSRGSHLGQSDSREHRELGPPVGETRNVEAQRKWWAEQRGYLMEDLYGSDSNTPAKGRRGSQALALPAILPEETRTPAQGEVRNLNGQFDREHHTDPADCSPISLPDDSPKQDPNIEWIFDNADAQGAAASRETAAAGKREDGTATQAGSKLKQPEIRYRGGEDKKNRGSYRWPSEKESSSVDSSRER